MMIFKHVLRRPTCLTQIRSLSGHCKVHEKQTIKQGYDQSDNTFLKQAYHVFDKHYSHEVNFNNDKILELSELFRSPIISSDNCQKILKGLVTTEELCDALYCLKYLPRDNELQKVFVSLLDKSSVKKLQVENMREKLNLCHSWFFSQIQMSPRKTKLHEWQALNYPKMMTNSCLTEKSLLDQLEAKDVLFVIFLASLYRQLPNAKKIAVSDGFHLPNLIENKCIEMWPDLDAEEIAVLASALYMTNTRLLQSNQKLAELFHKALLSVPEDLIGSSMSPINPLSKIHTYDFQPMFAKVKDNPGNAIIEKYQNHLVKMTFDDKVRLAKVIERCKPSTENHMDFLTKFLASLEQNPGWHSRVKDLEMLASVLINANYYVNVSNEPFLKISKLLDETPISDPRIGRSLVLTTRDCAIAGIWRDEFINQLFQLANNFRPFTSTCYSVTDCIDFLYNLSDCHDQETILKWKRTEKAFAQGLNQSSILAIANIDVLIELTHDKYQGHRLKPEIRRNLLFPEQNPPANSIRQRVEAFLFNQLKTLFGSKDQVYLGHPLPTDWASKDFIFCVKMDEKTKAVNIPQNYIEKLEEKLEICKPPKMKDYQWYCIVIVKRKTHRNGSGQLIGQMYHKVQLLEKIGYKVITMDLEDILTIFKYKGVLPTREFTKMLFSEK